MTWELYQNIFKGHISTCPFCCIILWLYIFITLSCVNLYTKYGYSYIFLIRFLLQTLQVHMSNLIRPLVASCSDLVSLTWSSIWPSNIDGINASYLNVHVHCRKALNGWPEAICACIYASFFNTGTHNSLSRYIALYIFHALFLVKSSWNQAHIIPHNLKMTKNICFALL